MYTFKLPAIWRCTWTALGVGEHFYVVKHFYVVLVKYECCLSFCCPSPRTVHVGSLIHHLALYMDSPSDRLHPQFGVALHMDSPGCRKAAFGCVFISKEDAATGWHMRIYTHRSTMRSMSCWWKRRTMRPCVTPSGMCYYYCIYYIITVYMCVLRGPASLH